MDGHMRGRQDHLGWPSPGCGIGDRLLFDDMIN